MNPEQFKLRIESAMRSGRYVTASRKTLEQLRGRYLSNAERVSYGYSIRCPRESSPEHCAPYVTSTNPMGSHRLDLYFLRPEDGYPPIENRVLYEHFGNSVDGLTLFDRSKSDGLIHIEGHWCGYIVDSVVFDVRKADA